MFDHPDAAQADAQGAEDKQLYAKPESRTAALDTAVRTSGKTISDSVDEQLTAIADLVCGLQAATATYHDRPLDWSDVASLTQVREYLGGVVKGFRSAETADSMYRAARQVATEIRQFRQMEQASR